MVTHEAHVSIYNNINISSLSASEGYRKSFYSGRGNMDTPGLLTSIDVCLTVLHNVIILRCII